jgi:hypothetical protein
MKIMHNLEYRKPESVCLYSVLELDEGLVTEWKKSERMRSRHTFEAL